MVNLFYIYSQFYNSIAKVAEIANVESPKLH